MEEVRTSRLKDIPATLGAVYLSLTVAGFSVSLFDPLGIRVAGSLAAYSAMLALYAFGTGAGWRSPIPVYVAGALLYPVLLVALLLGVESLGRSPSLVTAAFALAAGINVGFQFQGGADTPLEAYLGPWLANFVLPIVAVVGAKDILRFVRGG